ncbi:MBL fold metallo-hydrolase [Salinilacihabitans rarus]|uniref:MBL fold metallo-hydrolase n=1 Tax=Salinilacihabitans rarus TaxID=2961596 RepID=UPI0020C92172|nr:MBL fold metallo-hydrolase [Salinilacihabitans rarus]
MTEPRTAAVADGVYRCGSERVNWYVVAADGELTVVDAGFPGHWPQLPALLDALGSDLTDVAACVLTHAHPDHAGFAARLREAADVPVWVHEAGVEAARGEWELPVAGTVKNLWRPEMLRYGVEFVRSGGTSVPPVRTVRTFGDGETLDVPGRPRAIHAPGHSEDHVALSVPDREVLFCGDALATVDFVAGRGHRPQLLPAWINRNHDRARESIARLEPLGEVTLLPGHGDPWRGRTETAVELALERE